MYKFLHGDFLTPQELGDILFFKLACKGGEIQNEIYDICFLNICEKHPLIGENCDQSLKNINLANFTRGIWRKTKNKIKLS